MKRALAVCICTLAPHLLCAQTITVTTPADSGPGTLRQAVADATAGGNIVFDSALLPGIVTLTSGELLVDKDLTITGPGADRLTISGNNASRVFRIEAGAAVRIFDVTISNGRSADGVHAGTPEDGQDGGGILNLGALTLVQVVMTSNRTGDGSTSYSVGADGGDGGAIANVDGTLRIFRSTLSDNSTGAGGNCTGHWDEIGGCAIGPGDGGNGGAISNTGSNGMVHISRSSLLSNATGPGGSHTLPLSFGRGGSGGALFTGATGPTSVLSSTISGNSTGGVAPGFAGGIYHGVLTLISTTITNNDGAGSGGVFSILEGSTFTAANSIIAGNSAQGDPDDSNSDCNLLSHASQGYNLVGLGTGCDFLQPSDLRVVPSDVFSIALGPLQDDGGPTATHGLLLNSPAIDQGSCAGEMVDQRGYAGSPTGPRIVDLPGPNADDGCDIGAYEQSGIPLDLGVYFKRPSGWGYPHIRYFDTDPDIGSTSWPGKPMLHVGCGWYWWRFAGAVSAHMVFNGHSTPQTVELFRSASGWYDGNTNNWSRRSPDPPCEDLVRVEPRAFLQGAYQSGGLMSRALQQAGVIPALQPYGDEVFAGSPLAHNGYESNVDFASGSLIATDWSIVELWSGNTADTKVAVKAAIHLDNGYLVDPITLGQVEFPGLSEGPYYIVVRHRNHLPIMSAFPVTLGSGGTTFDFTVTSTNAFGTNPQTSLDGGAYWAMWAAEANLDGDIQALDFNAYVAKKAAGASGYEPADFNLNASVEALDFYLYIANTTVGAASQLPE